MVFVKRMLNNGSNGNRSSVVPRAPRSIRKRSLREKKFVGPQLCAFELLATVAGKLLEESECSSSTSSSVAVGFDKCGTVNKRVNEQLVDQGCSEGSVYLSENQKGLREEKLEVVSGDHVSAVVSSTCSEKVESDPKLATVKNRHDDIVEKGTSGELNTVVISEKIVVDAGSPDNFIPEDVNDVKMARNDYDEILFRCSQSKHSRKKARPPTKSADQKFRKLLTSEYWKTGPKLMDCKPTNAGDAVKNNSNNKRPCYEIDESQRKTPLKKRLLFDRSSVVTNDGGVSCESVSNSPEKSIDDNNATIAGNEKLCSAFRSQTSNDSGNTHVRLSIKSFKVPELFIEVPENTTVDSLKRTVLEAVTSILDNGLRVGVILHGKKIRDDNRTLLQAGISQADDMNTVGFMLEPNSPTRPSTPRSPREPKARLLCDSPKFSPRSQISLQKDVFLLDSQDKPYAADLKSPTQSSRDLVPSVAVELSEKKVADSEALALALLPVNQKPKRSELGQRRTRRPFSVSEVEALVHAVEKLGTGRWRDIKLCSFDNAMHRTYVDLKDKWKTLVHTASISPQQRRGEPVPQELLDRVLAAQAYWSEHPIKTLDKPLQQCLTVPKLTDSTTT